METREEKTLFSELPERLKKLEEKVNELQLAVNSLNIYHKIILTITSFLLGAIASHLIKLHL